MCIRDRYSAKKKGQRRASGQPIKHWGKVTDCEVDFNKFAPALRAQGRNRPPRVFADNQISQYIFIGTGAPSARSCQLKQEQDDDLRCNSGVHTSDGNAGKYEKKNGPARRIALTKLVRRRMHTSKTPNQQDEFVLHNGTVPTIAPKSLLSPVSYTHLTLPTILRV